MLDGNKAGEIWAIALSEDGQYLAATSMNGRINVWDNLANRAKIREFETKGSFGLCIDLVCRKCTFRYSQSDNLQVCRWEIHCIWAREWRGLHFQQ